MHWRSSRGQVWQGAMGWGVVGFGEVWHGRHAEAWQGAQCTGSARHGRHGLARIDWAGRKAEAQRGDRPGLDRLRQARQAR